MLRIDRISGISVKSLAPRETVKIGENRRIVDLGLWAVQDPVLRGGLELRHRGDLQGREVPAGPDDPRRTHRLSTKGLTGYEEKVLEVDV